MVRRKQRLSENSDEGGRAPASDVEPVMVDVKKDTLKQLPEVSDLDRLSEEDIATDCGIPLTSELKMYALDMLSEP